MEQVKLQDIPADLLNVREVLNRKDCVVSGISTDSRQMQTGDLFVALRGERFDGHRFIQKAAEAGAVAIVADKNGIDGFENLPVPILLVDDTLQFLMNLSAWYRRRFHFPLVGLTGSAGKTTTKELLVSILQQRLTVVKTQGNRNNFIGVPLTLFQLHSAAQAAVIEMGTSHPGEISRLTRLVRPDLAAITQIGSGHIGFFGSREKIYEEKRALLDEAPSGAKLFLNVNDAFLKNYSREDAQIIKCGTDASADYHAEIVKTDEAGFLHFRMNGGAVLKLGVAGRHHLMNGLLAAAIAREMGLTEDEIKTGLASVQNVGQRMEIARIKDLLIINDAYNANPESMR
ncbi:MAG: UDP-N-acetylmuramoyl-tripeptide--D-alanyl-D-alanine ligase, partial [Calditrichia bacterium]